MRWGKRKIETRWNHITIEWTDKWNLTAEEPTKQCHFGGVFFSLDKINQRWGTSNIISLEHDMNSGDKRIRTFKKRQTEIQEKSRQIIQNTRMHIRTWFDVRSSNFSLIVKLNSDKLALNQQVRIETKQQNTRHWILMMKLIVVIIQKNEQTKRDELSLRMVFAFPNASRMGLAWMICSSTVPYFEKERQLKIMCTRDAGKQALQDFILINRSGLLFFSSSFFRS